MANLLLLCSDDHALIDATPEIYTVDVLIALKTQHEASVRAAIEPTPSLGPGRLDPGTVVGASRQRWRVGGLIGEGGTARVYAVERTDGLRGAAKILSGHRFEVTAPMRERFAREIRHLQSINDPHVIRVLDTGLVGREPVLIIELAECSLHRVLSENRRHGLPRTVSLGIFEQVLRGVAALHERRLVHRDLSPKNILIGKDGQLRIADFGTLRHFLDETLTDAADAIGSIIYVSRQQFDDPHKADTRDDVYSLGQIGWELLAARRPVGNPAPLSTVAPDLPQAIVSLIEDMRSDDPVRRPASAVESLARFSSIQRDEMSEKLRPRTAALNPANRERYNASDFVRIALQSIEARQRQHANGARSSGKPDGELLSAVVERVGPVRFAVMEASDRLASAGSSCERFSHLIQGGSMSASRLKISWPGTIGELVEICNAATHLFAAWAPDDLPLWPRVDVDTTVVDSTRLSPDECPLDLFGDSAWLRGRPCLDCGYPLRLTVEQPENILSERGQISLGRSAICFADDEGEPWRCCLCGDVFSDGSYDENVDVEQLVVCRCPDLPYWSGEFGDAPWRKSRPVRASDLSLVFGCAEGGAG